jgi:hypothetical protein
MRRLAKNKHFITALGFSIICTSIIMSLGFFRASDAQIVPLAITVGTSLSGVNTVKGALFITPIKDTFASLIIDGEKSETVTMSEYTKASFYYSWDTTKFPNGTYSVRIKYADYYSEKKTVTIANATTDISNTNTDATPAPSFLNIVLPQDNETLSGDVGLLASSSVDSVLFIISGTGGTKALSATRTNGGYFEATLDTSSLPDGDYAIKAKPTNAELPNSSVSISIANTSETDPVAEAPAETSEALPNEETTSIATPPIEENIEPADTTADISNNAPDPSPETIVEPVLTFLDHSDLFSLNTAFYVQSNTKPDSIEFIINGESNQEKFRKEAYEESPNIFRLSWPSALDFGSYTIIARATFGTVLLEPSIIVNYQDATSNDIEISKPPISAPAPSPITDKQTVSPDTISNVPIFTPRESHDSTPRLAPKPSNLIITPLTETVLKPSSPKITDKTCAAIGINDANACQTYLSLPRICRQNSINERVACDEFINLPYICQMQSQKTAADCEKFLIAASLPDVCRQAGITGQNECRAHIEKSRLPEKCQSAGMLDFKACAAFLETEKNKEAEKIKERSLCGALGLKEEKACQAYLDWSKNDQECHTVMIEGDKACQDYLIGSFGAKTCKEAGINNAIECQSFIYNTASKNSTCEAENEWECSLTLDKKLGTLASTQAKYDQIEKVISKDKTGIKAKEITEKAGDYSGLLPIEDREAGITLRLAERRIIINEDLVQTSPLVIMIDSDQDGLSDDIELRAGCNPNDQDSDKDGFDDYTEYKNGYDPNGPGKAIKNKPQSTEEALMNAETLEHPKSSGQTIGQLRVSGFDEDKKKLQGKADPDTVYALYIYSDLPLVTTVRTDEYGNWEYVFQKSLVDGKHEVYLTLNDNTGKIVSKSNPLSFFIKEAKAVTAEEFISDYMTEKQDESDSMMLIYILVASLGTALGLGAFAAYFIYHKRNQSLQ